MRELTYCYNIFAFICVLFLSSLPCLSLPLSWPIFFLCSETLYKKNIVPSPKTTNPFLTSEVQEDPMPDIALQALAMETSKRTSSE